MKKPERLQTQSLLQNRSGKGLFHASYSLAPHKVKQFVLVIFYIGRTEVLI